MNLLTLRKGTETRVKETRKEDIARSLRAVSLRQSGVVEREMREGLDCWAVKFGLYSAAQSSAEGFLSGTTPSSEPCT